MPASTPRQRFLEYIEDKNRTAEGTRFTERLPLTEYEKIPNQFLAGEGCWRRIARAWPRRELAEDIGENAGRLRFSHTCLGKSGRDQRSSQASNLLRSYSRRSLTLKDCADSLRRIGTFKGVAASWLDTSLIIVLGDL